MLSMRHRAFAIAALSTAFIAPSLAHASPQDLFGFGARSSAMGGTGVSIADEYGAVHSNPAGLSRAHEPALSLGYVGASYALYIAQGGGDAQPEHGNILRATVIGAVLPLPFGGFLRDRLTVGLGFFTPTDVVVRGRISRPETPQFLLITDRAQSVALQLGLGLDLGYGVRVGAGVSALAAIAGSVLIATDATGRVSSRVDDQLVASYAPVLGASWEFGALRIGAVYRGALVGRFGVTIEARDIGLPLPVFNIAGVAQYDPWEVAGEVGFVRAPWSLVAGVTYKAWSAYPGPLEATTASSDAPPPPNFHDTLVFRAGAEYRWQGRNSHVALRAGYFYEPTPAPPATGVANYLDNDRHVGTAGVSIGGRALGTLLTVDLFGQVHYLVPRTDLKSEGVASDNPGAPSIRYGGTMYFVGLTATVTF